MHIHHGVRLPRWSGWHLWSNKRTFIGCLPCTNHYFRVFVFYFLIPSTALWDIFTCTFQQMKMLEFSYNMSTKQLPADLTRAHFWCSGSDNSSHGFSLPKQEEPGLRPVLGPVRGLWPQASSLFKANLKAFTWKTVSAKLRMTLPHRGCDLHSTSLPFFFNMPDRQQEVRKP